MSLVHLSKKNLRKRHVPQKSSNLKLWLEIHPATENARMLKFRVWFFIFHHLMAAVVLRAFFMAVFADNKFHVQVQCEHRQLIPGTGFEFYYVSVWLHSSNLIRQSHNRDQRRTARLVQDDRKVEEALNSNNPEFPMRRVGRWASAAEDRPQLVPLL